MLKRTLVSIGALAAASALAGCGSSTTSSVPTTSCTYTASGTSAGKDVTLPPSSAPKGPVESATIVTGVGTLNASLTTAATPCTDNSFVSLAKQGYFDDTPCHRLTTAGIYVLQCGDPSGTGSGGPGYSFDDELSGSETYPAGTLAMANAGPNTNGSQFFIVYKASPLPASYTVFGTVDAASTAVVAKVAAAGSDNSNGQGDGAPNTKVQITSVTIG